MSNYKVTAGQTISLPFIFGNASAVEPSPQWSIEQTNGHDGEFYPGGAGIVGQSPYGSTGGYATTATTSLYAYPPVTALNVTVPSSAPTLNNMQAEYEFSDGYYRSVLFDIVAYVAPPAAPTALTATNGQNNAVPLTWTAPSGTVTQYNIYGSKVSGGPYTLLGSSSTTSYTDYSAVNGTTDYYVVTAVNGSAESAYSGQASATPAAPAGGGGGGGGGSTSTLPAGVNLWAAGASPAASSFATAPLLVDGAVNDGMTGYNGT